MKCIECGAQMRKGEADIKGSYRGEPLVVHMDDAVACPQCGYATIHGRSSEEFTRRLKEEYRKAHQLLSPNEFRSIRAHLGNISQDAFAAFLSVGVASVKRWESGSVQEPVFDRHVRWKTNPQSAEVDLQDNYFRVSSLHGSWHELVDVGQIVSMSWNVVTPPFEELSTSLLSGASAFDAILVGYGSWGMSVDEQLTLALPPSSEPTEQHDEDAKDVCAADSQYALAA